MKQQLGVLLAAAFMLMGSGAASAQEYGITKHAIYGAVGFTDGGFALGAEYENTGFRDYGIGGFVRMYQKDDDGTNRADGYTTFGAFIRPHFTKKDWDFYVSPGFGLISIDAFGNTPPGDTTTLGPSLALGLIYDLNGSVALGVENMRTWVWFNDDWRGLQHEIDDLMFKFRVAF